MPTIKSLQNFDIFDPGVTHINGFPLFGEQVALYTPSAFFLTSASFSDNFPISLENPSTFFNERWRVRAGDIGVLLVETIDTETPTILSPAGWDEAPNSPVTNSGTNPTRLHVYWKRIDTNEPTLELDAIGDHQTGVLLFFRDCIETGNPWDVTSAGTPGSGTTVTFPTVASSEVGGLAIAAVASTSAEIWEEQFFNWSSNDLTDFREIYGFNDGIGSGGGVSVAIGTKDAAGVINVSVEQQTASEYAQWVGVLKRRTTPRIQTVNGLSISDFALNVSGYGASYGFEPLPKPGDIIVFFMETIADTVTTTTPGWEAIPDSPVTNSAGLDTTRLSGFWTRVEATDEVTPTLDFTGPAQAGQIIAIRGCPTTSSPWNVTAIGTPGSDTSITIPGATTTVNNCLVLAATSTSAHLGSSTPFSSWTNADLTNVVERMNFRAQDFNAMHGGGVGLATGEKATAGAFGTTAVTQALSEEYAPWVGALVGESGMPTVVGVGSFSGGGASYAGPTIPDSVAENDVLVMFVETEDTEARILYSTGWEEAPNSPVSNSSGDATRLSIFWKRCGPRVLSPPTFSGFTDHMHGVQVYFRGCIEEGDPWDVTSATTGSTGTAITLAGGVTTEDDCLVVAAVATTHDILRVMRTFSEWENANLTDVVEEYDFQSSVGTGGGIAVATGYKEDAGLFGATTATQTNSVAWCGWVGALKPAQG